MHIVFTVKSTPIVALNLSLNWLWQNRCRKHVLPTPESPTNTTLNMRSGVSWNKQRHVLRSEDYGKSARLAQSVVRCPVKQMDHSSKPALWKWKWKWKWKKWKWQWKWNQLRPQFPGRYEKGSALVTTAENVCIFQNLFYHWIQKWKETCLIIQEHKFLNVGPPTTTYQEKRSQDTTSLSQQCRI